MAELAPGIVGVALKAEQLSPLLADACQTATSNPREISPMARSVKVLSIMLRELAEAFDKRDSLYPRGMKQCAQQVLGDCNDVCEELRGLVDNKGERRGVEFLEKVKMEQLQTRLDLLKAMMTVAIDLANFTRELRDINNSPGSSAERRARIDKKRADLEESLGKAVKWDKMRLLQENLEDLDDNASAGPSLVQRTEIDDKRHSNSIKIASFELRSRHGDPSSGQVRGRSDYHGEESHERRSSPRAFKANKTLRSLLSYWEELQDMIDTPQQERSAEEGERSGTRATQPPIDNRDTARTHEPKVKREHKKPTIDEWIEGTEVSTRDMQQDPASRPSHDERESHHPRVVVEDPRREHAAPSIADWIANTEVSTRDEEYEASHPRTFPKETEVRTSSPVAEKRSRSRVVDENMDRSPQVQQPSPKHYHEGLRTMIHATRSPSPSEREKDRYMPPSPPYSTTSVVDQDHNVHNVVHHHHIHHHHDAPRDASRDTRERRDGRDGRDGRDAAPRHAPIEAPPPLPRRPSTHAHDVDPRRPRMVDEFWHILQASGGVHWETRKKRKDRLVIKQYVGPVMCRQGETKWSDLTVAGSAWTSLPRRYCSRSVLLDLRYDFKDDKHDFHVIEELDYAQVEEIVRLSLRVLEC